MNDIGTWLRPLDRQVRATNGTRSVLLRRHYDTTPDDVWDAWTNPDRLKRWLGGVTGDLHEGGDVVLDMGDERPAHCTIVLCDAPNRLVATWSFPGEWDSAAELTLTADGGGTVVQLEHVGLADETLSRDYGEGWEDFLHVLGQYLHGEPKTSLKWEEVRNVLDPYWEPLAANPDADDRWPVITPHGDNVDLAVQRHVAARPEDVWASLTEPERLAEWFAGVEFAHDGWWTATFPQGKASGRVHACDEGYRLVTSWRWDHDDAHTRLEVTLRAERDGTAVHLVHRVAPTVNVSGRAAGWYAHLSGLRSYHAGHKVVDADWEANFAMAHAATRDHRESHGMGSTGAPPE